MFMKRATAAAFVLCLAVCFLLAAGCSSSPATGKDSAQTASAGTTGTVSPAASSDAAKPLRAMPADLPKIDVPAGSVAKYYVYTLNGTEGVIGLALPTAEYQDLQAKGKPKAETNIEYFQAFMNEPTQQKYVAELADAIKKKSADPDEQARIAISLVQHIPFHHGDTYRYPYEVMYDGTGICGEKSMLLALLLKDLGYGSCTFFFKTEGHMTAGIKAAAPYDYKGTGYAFIETTEPKIVTYDQTYFPEFKGTLKSTPEVVPEGTGRAFDSVAEDYRDAQEWERLGQAIHAKTLTSVDRSLYKELDAKYDLSYYTCQTCALPALA